MSLGHRLGPLLYIVLSARTCRTVVGDSLMGGLNICVPTDMMHFNWRWQECLSVLHFVNHPRAVITPLKKNLSNRQRVPVLQVCNSSLSGGASDYQIHFHLARS
ncbi:hypothetical protein EDB19DRAFT_280123 [Suillus lakei]|nr:hypothetical protein EDB19DRAFT_280123 [Suillus lakei]